MRRRIVVLAVLAAVLATSLFGIPLAVGVARYYLDDERAELEHLADKAAIAVAADLVRGSTLADLPASGSEVELGLYGTDGRRLAGRGPGTADVLVDRARDGAVHSDDIDGQLVVAVPVSDTGGGSAVIRAGSDYSSVRSRIGWTWALMVGLGALAVVATWLVARWQARRLAAPLEELSRTAQQLGGGNFGVRTASSGIPEIDSAGTSLNTTAERLGALVSRERAFAAEASHQLRTPLTGLRLGLETSLDSPGADLRQAVAGALDAADRLERTIDDLLTLAREPGRNGVVLAVDELATEVDATWRPVLAAQGRAFRVDVQPGLPVTTAAPAAVRQVLGVLLDNAARHGAGTVTVTVRDAGETLAFDVADEGSGLDGSDSLPRRAEGRPGHGIGLELARNLAVAEGGRLRLTRPAPPVFTLLLPADTADRKAPADSSPEAAARS